MGRRAPKKLNETDTTFKTKNIVVREQSVVSRKLRALWSGRGRQRNVEVADPRKIISSRRRLTIDEMLAQADHHKGTVRREAIEELRDTVKAYGVHSGGISLSLGTILGLLKNER